MVQAANQGSVIAREGPPRLTLRPLTECLMPVVPVERFPMPDAQRGYVAVEATSAVCFVCLCQKPCKVMRVEKKRCDVQVANV